MTRLTVLLSATAVLAISCTSKRDIIPAAGPDRASGQSSLMGKTFAGQNACNPDNHLRPFIIEWDATDMSSFQARTATDVVFVKYEGCSLTVLEGCVDDQVRGAYGSYAPPKWTSGSVEKIEIRDEGELYAKLPLGVATIGGRVSAGEQFLMEYFVAGTRRSTRPAVYRGELESNPACADATHFVHGYNLGAFALGSNKQMSGEVNASVQGIGAGGKRSRESRAEKKGGQISVCRSESAAEVKDCQVPIRLTLREITPGDNPDASASTAEESDAALNLAGKMKSEGDRMKMANELRATAMQAMQSKDGKACLKAFDAADRLDPDPGRVSTNPRGVLMVRAMCVMLSGQCAAGKKLARQAKMASDPGWRPEQYDQTVNGLAATMCQGAKMSLDDNLRKHARRLRSATFNVVPAQDCKAAVAYIRKNASKAKDPAVGEDAKRALFQAPACFAASGDCKASWASYKKIVSDNKAAFEVNIKACKGKI